MSRSVHSRAFGVARNVALGALTFFGLRALYVHVQGFVGTDPFERLREEQESGLGQSVGIRLPDVDVSAYRGGKLVTSAQADQIDVNRQDRELFTMTGIRNGVFTEDAKRYGYSANQAVWQGQGRQLSMSGMVRVQNADLDLRTDSVEFNDMLHTLNTPQPISGRLYHGTLTATGFKLDTKTQDYSTGKVEYAGDLAMLQQKDDSDENAKHRWYFSGDASKGVRATKDSPAVTYYVNGHARDDEMILKADLVARYKDTDVVVATGNVKYYSGKADISADRATIYQREKRVVMVGHVTIYVKPKSDEDKPPVEEALPPFKRSTPDEMVAASPEGAEKSAKPVGTSANPPIGSSAGSKGTPTTGTGSGTVPPPTSGPPTGSAAGSPPATPGSAPNSAPAVPANNTQPVTRQTPTPTGTTGGQQTPTPGTATGAGGQVTPATTSHPGGPASANGQARQGTASKDTPQNKAQTDEQKELDKELRSGKSVRKYPMVIVCDEVQYWYRKGQRHGHIVGSPQGRQDLPQARWRFVWSSSADYDGEKDQLTLYSSTGKEDVRMKNSKGDDVTALTITVSTRDDADEEEYSARKPQGVGWVESSDDASTTDKSKTKTKG